MPIHMITWFQPLGFHCLMSMLTMALSRLYSLIYCLFCDCLMWWTDIPIYSLCKCLCALCHIVYILWLAVQLGKMCVHIYGKQMWYNLWHSLGIMRKLFVEPSIFYYLCPVNYVAVFSFISAMHCAKCHCKMAVASCIVAVLPVSLYDALRTCCSRRYLINLPYKQGVPHCNTSI